MNVELNLALQFCQLTSFRRVLSLSHSYSGFEVKMGHNSPQLLVWFLVGVCAINIFVLLLSFRGNGNIFNMLCRLFTNSFFLFLFCGT